MNKSIQMSSHSGFSVRRYLAFGSSMDYMYEELHVQYPLTIEVGMETDTTDHHNSWSAHAHPPRFQSCSCKNFSFFSCTHHHRYLFVVPGWQILYMLF